MVVSTKVLCPLFDEIDILTPGDSPSIFPSLDCGISIRYRNEEMTLLKQLLSGCAKALCPFHSSTKVLSPAVDLIPTPTLIFMTCNV